MILKIDDVIGKEVTVDFGDHEDNFENKRVSCKLSGKLEYDDTGEPDRDETKAGFYVRVKEDYYGTSGITFPRRNVLRCEAMPSGRIQIDLK